MSGKKNRKPDSINRRSFVGNTVKLVTFGTLLMPLVEACNNNKSSKPTLPNPEKDKKRTPHTAKKPRKKWSHESLVMNSKTKVMHFPSSKMYTYYDEIKPNHLQEISLATWAAQWQEPARMHLQQSGNILEILPMLELTKGVTNELLTVAAATLSKAFTPACENSKGFNFNTTNFRLHELMLQLIALNNQVPAADKWQTFNSKIKKPPALRKRQKWMETETSFNERVKYILDRQNDYTARLAKRAAKYAVT